MSCYARVENGCVMQVIVADAAFVKRLPGVWLETTHGARGGIHYNDQGQPDDQPVVRKNYAGPQSLYDEKDDAFYQRCSRPFAVLNRSTYLWEPCLPRPYSFPPQHSETPCFLLFKEEAEKIDPWTWDNLKKNLGISFTYEPSKASLALPLTDEGTVLLMSEQRYEHLRPFDANTFFHLTDRVGMASLGFNVLPTFIPRNREMLYGMFNEPVFVKHRRTYSKSENRFSYTLWNSPMELANATDANFWEEQNCPNPNTGEWVVQPALSYPLTSLNLHVSVNAQGNAWVWSQMSRLHNGPNEFGDYVPYEGGWIELLPQIQRVCTERGIKQSFHELEFVWYQGKWCLMDWNPRLTGPFIQCLANFYPVLNNPFLHALGLPLQYGIDGLYVAQRCYPDLRLTERLNESALRLGLLPFYDGDVLKLSAAGQQKEVLSSFNSFESLLS